MNHKEYKSKWLTMLLLLILALVLYLMAAVFISGPYYAIEKEDEKIESVIRGKEKDIVSIERQSFSYVTYVCETKSKYVVYDQTGKKIITRKKKELQLDKVEKLIDENYKGYKKMTVNIGYAYDNIAYIVTLDEDKVLIDFDELKIVFDTREGKQ